ncbi:MAG: hypothetical protein V4510_02215 [bacterium]
MTAFAIGIPLVLAWTVTERFRVDGDEITRGVLWFHQTVRFDEVVGIKSYTVGYRGAYMRRLRFRTVRGRNSRALRVTTSAMRKRDWQFLAEHVLRRFPEPPEGWQQK